MICQHCSSERVAQIHGKTDDRCSIHINGKERADYVPSDFGLGCGGDYISIDLCLNCGQVQGKWPLEETALEFQAMNLP